MKITVDVDKNYIENEVVIKCSEINEEIINLQKIITTRNSKNSKIELYKNNVEFYESLENILFFETESDVIKAHTRNNIFETKSRLYELENILPYYFCRISKSAIVNVKEIYSITKNITASSKIEFKDTRKHIFVSRGYFKPLKNKIDEIRSTTWKKEQVIYFGEF